MFSNEGAPGSPDSQTNKDFRHDRRKVLAFDGRWFHTLGMTEFEDGGDRAGQVLEVAEAIMLETRSVSLTLNDIADRIGVSRSLLYVYYDGVPAILDAIFQIHLGRLEEHLPLQGDDGEAFERRAIGANLAYFHYLVEAGPVLQLILKERNQDSPLGQESRKRFMRLARSLATQTCHALALEPREAFVLIELNGAIPEALARLVRSGEIDQETAAQTCERLIAASLQSFALRPTH